MSASLISEIGELIRPLFIPHLEEWLRYYEAQELTADGPDSASSLSQSTAGLRKLLAEGGRWTAQVFALVDESGIEYEPLSVSDLGLLDGAVSARVTVNSTYGTKYPHVHLTQSAEAVGLAVDAQSDDLTDLHARIEALLRATVREVPATATGPLRVFVGHGGDYQWEQVRDAVQGAGYEVEVFEADERASESILQVVLGMIRRSHVALIVMTGADQLSDQVKLPRANVVHELGLAQGLIGVENTVVLLEEGTRYPSNIQGHIQIRFDKGALHRKLPNVLRAIELRAPQ